VRFFAPIAAAVLGNLLYHSSQRLTPAAASPFLSLGVSFGVASALCFLFYKATAGSLFSDVRLLSWTSLGLGFSVVIIESAILMAYRLGWPIGITGLTVTALQTALLIPIGRFFLAERLSPAAWAGVALCLAGLALIGLSAKA